MMGANLKIKGSKEWEKIQIDKEKRSLKLSGLRITNIDRDINGWLNIYHTTYKLTEEEENMLFSSIKIV